MTTTLAEIEALDGLGPRVDFWHRCKRCQFAHAASRACPRCSDTYEFDTEWTSWYNGYMSEDDEVSVTAKPRGGC